MKNEKWLDSCRYSIYVYTFEYISYKVWREKMSDLKRVLILLQAKDYIRVKSSGVSLSLLVRVLLRDYLKHSEPADTLRYYGLLADPEKKKKGLADFDD
jgi:hypothetical protein